MTFNPNSPCVVGNEWFVTHDFPLAVSGDVADTATCDAYLESSVTEAIESVGVFIDAGRGTTQDRLLLRGIYTIEVYDADNLGDFQTTITRYNPSADTTHVGDQTANYDGATLSAGGAGTRWDKVDNGDVLTPGTFLGVEVQDADFIIPLNGQVAFWSHYYNGIVGDLTGEQIISVKLRAIVDQFGDVDNITEPVNAKVTPFLVLGGAAPAVRFDAEPAVFQGRQPGGLLIEGEWFVNPVTAKPWTVGDIEKFDDGVTQAAAGFVIAQNGDSFQPPVLYSLWLEITHRPEVRIAFGGKGGGAVGATPLEPGWNLIEMTEPDGTTPDWPKLNGTNYLITLRRRPQYGDNPWGRALVPILAGDGDQPNQLRGASVLFDAALRIPKEITDTSADGGPGMLLMTSPTTLSADTQPYTSADGDDFPALGIDDDWPVVDNTTRIAQVFIPATTDDFGFVRFLARLESDQVVEDLTVRIHATSGFMGVVTGAPVSVPLTFAPTDLTTPRDQYQILEGYFDPPPTLTSATVYQLVFTSDAEPGDGWRIQVISAVELLTGPGATPLATPGTTYGSDTQYLMVDDGGGEVVHGFGDVCATVAVVPDTMELEAEAAGESDECVDYITLSWEEQVLACGTFLQYEIDRSDDDGDTWQRIAEITDDEVTTVDDYESVRNAEAQYRIRLRRVDGAASFWSEPAAATATMTCCGILFTSNQAPDRTVWYDDTGDRGYDFLEDTQLVSFQDRDGQVQFRGLEDRLDAFQLTLLIGARRPVGPTRRIDSPCGPGITPGRRAFDPLLILMGNKRDRSTGEKVTTAYVCVHTRDGDRWFAALSRPSGSIKSQPTAVYEMPVSVTETTDTPAPFDAAS